MANSSRTGPSSYTLDNVDPIHLIKSIKKHPEIWNPNILWYRDKIRRRVAWESICRTYFPSYDCMQPNDQEEISDFIMKKWRNIKDACLKDLKYNVSKKGDSRNRTKKRYKYSKYLSFLQPVFASSLNDISLMDENQFDGFNESHIPECHYDGSQNANESDSEPDIIPLIPIGSSKAKKRRVAKEEAEEEEAFPLEICTVTSLNEEATPLLQEVSLNPAEPEQNQDKLFFDSLLPMVNDFTDRERLEFRVDILNVIKNIRNKRDD